MKRIVKETLDNGDIKYRVETNKLFGIFTVKWYTDIAYFDDMPCDAVFDTIEEAKIFAGIRLNKIINKEIIYE